MQRSELLEQRGQQQMSGRLMGWPPRNLCRSRKNAEQTQCQRARPPLKQRHTVKPGSQRRQHM
ncbi:MAG: hypothetical protein A2002_12420 [Pseudomonadales bacterium GWC1_66_9]|nr:MAG: hypothetical protein A2002_12420 [Pseudomonadales bacterium GWC1_66_9]